MYSKLTTCLLLCCWLAPSIAQDSLLLGFEKIAHLNGAEKRIFGALGTGEKVDAISLLVAIDEDGKNGQWKAEDIVESHAREFEKERKKGTEKFVKALHKSLHANRLRYYQEICTLSETIAGGAYNCVSATALFALIFDKVGYAYAIHQTPNHVYLVVEPQGTNIVVETTTDDRKAQITINDAFKKAFLEYLQKTKQLSPKETAGMDNNEIFEHYFFGDEVITLQQLAGIQYYNDGLLHLEKKDYDKALSQFEKAYLLNPSERFRFLTVYCTANLLDNTEEKTSPSAISLTGKFLRYSGDATAKEYVRENFEASTLKLLLQKPDLVTYSAYSEAVLGEVKDSALSADLLFTKYFYLCKYHGLKQEFDRAKHFAEKAIALNSDHLEVKHLLMVSELELLRTLNTSAKETVDSLDIFCARYPTVCEFPDIKELWLTTKIYALVLQFEDGTYDKLSPAETHKLRIKLVEDIEPQLVGLRNNSKNGLHGIYAEIAAYEFRMTNFEVAKEWLRRGLRVFPNNSDLKTRLKNIEEFTKD